MANEKLQVMITPFAVYHLNAYLESLRVNQIKDKKQLSAVSETLDALSELIAQAQDFQAKQTESIAQK